MAVMQGIVFAGFGCSQRSGLAPFICNVHEILFAKPILCPPEILSPPEVRWKKKGKKIPFHGEKVKTISRCEDKR